MATRRTTSSRPAPPRSSAPERRASTRPARNTPKAESAPPAAASKKDDLQPWITNKSHPRFGDDWRYYVNLIRTDFHNQQTLKNALKIAKAWSHFCQAALGVGKVPPARSDVMPERGDTPDVQERHSKSAAGEVSGRYFSYENPFSNHWDMVFQQMAQGSAAVYKS
jgi:hypothetical protein